METLVDFWGSIHPSMELEMAGELYQTDSMDPYSTIWGPYLSHYLPLSGINLPSTLCTLPYNSESSRGATFVTLPAEKHTFSGICGRLGCFDGRAMRCRGPCALSSLVSLNIALLKPIQLGNVPR